MPDLCLGEASALLFQLGNGIGQTATVAVLVLYDHVIILGPGRVIPDDVLVLAKDSVRVDLVEGVLLACATCHRLDALLHRVIAAVQPVGALVDRPELTGAEELELKKLLVVARYVGLMEGNALRWLLDVVVRFIGVD